MNEGPLLSEAFPELATEIETLLTAQGKDALASQIPGLRIVERCPCGDDFCATIYTVPRPDRAWRYQDPEFANLDLDAKSGMILLTVVHAKIAEIEILNRYEIRKKLDALIPLVKTNKGNWRRFS